MLKNQIGMFIVKILTSVQNVADLDYFLLQKRSSR